MGLKRDDLVRPKGWGRLMRVVAVDGERCWVTPADESADDFGTIYPKPTAMMHPETRNRQ